MKSNPKTGELTLPSGMILSPRLTRVVFLASVEGAQAKVSVENEPWGSFSFEDREDSIGVVVVFEGDRLESVQLTVDDPKFGAGWDDWSEEKELERKQANDRWLRSNGLVPGKRYAWGSVWSGYSPKSGFSLVVVRFGNDK